MLVIQKEFRDRQQGSSWGHVELEGMVKRYKGREIKYEDVMERYN